MHLPASFFSTELFWSALKWLMMLGVWGVFALGTWREDRNIRKILRGHIEQGDAAALLRILHRRDMRIWLQITLLLVVVAANDISHDMALLPPGFFTTPPPAATTAIAVPKGNVPDRYDQILKKSAAQALPFSDITEFNEQNSKQEAYIDWLKERYESWLVTYYYLQKCNQAGADDYDSIRRSLEKELGSVHADKTVEGNILLAASGSYKGMYADIPCDGPHLSTTKSLYDANMQQIRKAVSPPGINQEPATPKATITR